MFSSHEVTFMMPTYNSVRYIDAAILSILSQEYRCWQLLAYDDYSDDGTYERLLFWESQDERIKVARPFSSHGEYVNICNQMIADAKGQSLARMDSDDITLPKRLSTELIFLRQKQAAVLVGSMAFCIMMGIQGDRIISNYPWLEKVVQPVASTEQPINEYLRTYNRIVHSSILARKTDIMEVGGYDDLTPFEDWDLALKLAAIGEVYILPDILTLKRQHERNFSKAHRNFQSAFTTLKAKHQLLIDKLIKASEL